MKKTLLQSLNQIHRDAFNQVCSIPDDPIIDECWNAFDDTVCQYATGQANLDAVIYYAKKLSKYIDIDYSAMSFSTKWNKFQPRLSDDQGV